MYAIDINYDNDASSVLYTGDEGLEADTHVAVRIVLGPQFMSAVDTFKAVVANNIYRDGVAYIRLVLADDSKPGHPGSGGTVLSRKTPSGVGDW